MAVVALDAPSISKIDRTAAPLYDTAAPMWRLAASKALLLRFSVRRLRPQSCDAPDSVPASRPPIECAAKPGAFCVASSLPLPFSTVADLACRMHLIADSLAASHSLAREVSVGILDAMQAPAPALHRIGSLALEPCAAPAADVHCTRRLSFEAAVSRQCRQLMNAKRHSALSSCIISSSWAVLSWPMPYRDKCAINPRYRGFPTGQQGS